MTANTNRRKFLSQIGAVGFGVSSAGCTVFGGSKAERVPVTVVAADVLNRRSDAYKFHFVAEYNEKPILAVSRRIEGTDNSSKPTVITFEKWPNSAGTYRFSFRLDGEDEWLRTTPHELGVADRKSCYRPVFVINLGNRVTAHRDPFDDCSSSTTNTDRNHV